MAPGFAALARPLALLLAASALQGPAAASRLSVRALSLDALHAVAPPRRRRRLRKRWRLVLGVAAQLGRFGDGLEEGFPDRRPQDSDSDQMMLSEAPQIQDLLLSEIHDNMLLSEAPRIQLDTDSPDMDIDLSQESFVELSEMEARELSQLITALDNEDPEVRKSAIEDVILSIAASNALFVSTLQNAVQDDDERVREAAIQKLIILQELPVPHGRAGLRKMLQDPSYFTRIAGLSAIAYRSDFIELEDFVALKQALMDEEMSVRLVAAQVLAALHKVTWRDVESIRDAMVGDDVYMRRAAVVALGNFAFERSYFSDLRKALLDEDPEVRLLTAMVLASAQNTSQEAFSLLRIALRDENETVRKAAVDAIAVNAHLAGDAEVLALVEALKDENDDVHWSASVALTDLGIKAWSGGLDAIAEALKTGDVFLRRAAVIALSTIGGRKAEIKETLVLSLAQNDEDPFARWVVAQMHGIGARLAWDGDIDSIHETFRTGDAFERRAAVSALGDLGEEMRSTDRNLLCRGMKDEDFGVRMQAAIELGNLAGMPSRRVISALREGLRDEHPEVVEVAIEASQKFEDARLVPDGAVPSS